MAIAASIKATGYLKGIALSYAQVYFSNRVWLGLLLMAVSFFDLATGLSGLAAIIICQLCAILFGFERSLIFSGSYSYTALMTGLAMGSLYEPGLAYGAVLLIASVFCFFLTVWMLGRMAKAGLPFLSLPFLITVWVVLAGLSGFGEVKLEVKESFTLQQLLPDVFTALGRMLDHLPAHDLIHTYLRSLSANIFQYNDVAGICIAIALLFRSRMAFALSIYGFLIGYAFYYFFQGDFTPLLYSYIGFNFILTAIALGGYFIVPSAKSHLLLFFVIPVTALLISALSAIFTHLNLPLYSLPYAITVLLMLAALQLRPIAKGLQLVALQQYSPEANHYKSANYKKRFGNSVWYAIGLPVMGEWYVSQGYAGKVTHRDGWQHALDFDMRNEEGKTFTGSGFNLKDYYCYDLPVLAPAAGYVTTIRDGIPDNAIGEANLAENWGNAIIIKHAEGLYSKLSHLKAYSFKVKEGSYVQAGEMVAHCGSSGRSPEPHLHFQLQAMPYIGAQTLPYPLGSYLTRSQDTYAFHTFTVPAEGETVRRSITNPLLAGAFDFIPGKELQWTIMQDGVETEQTWTAYTDSYNLTYLYCATTKSSAYFVNDGVLFYFTDFYGSRSSFLYTFYRSFQKVLLGYYPGVSIEDALLLQSFFNPVLMGLHDFVAPFVHFLDGKYRFSFQDEKNAASDAVTINTESYGQSFGKPVHRTIAALTVKPTGQLQLTIQQPQHKILARCVPVV